ncbi:UDP-3-O-(3-hydroxymyristoyl)glucosamine N-acyltransferase [Algoriphagus halophytocola]|uniref:UDP-3-O-acylglucosamine N-acyltransferase n=1 Tax=Algoriphagus halophytocola TaxID=2991499 RepID=A0ABY6MJU5_9BACT|nr:MULTISPECIES: UDP-3-O-(3-hydroxymyristoyl)glucosamine N-acyltransferase [unclassified Algoriphagus]UZD22556.1 UDP-3-O-(3-hydroxymyristoyl)glucosamine N-acyltransferase [Algoriphagus sp. TR-M5]WBL43819.1 UDP-3-O-(3-hydroxymyristoyl)glucosamine N-acyltransferase [Algoriphagus sp. TR-M9]
MEFTLGQVAQILQGKVEGDENAKVSRLDKIQEGKPGGISFLANEKYTSFIYDTEATAVIVSETFATSKILKTNLIRVKDAYSGFTQLLEAYSLMMKTGMEGVQEPAFADPSAQLGSGTFRGAFSYIGKNAQIADGVKIHQQVHIGDRVKIGKNTIIHPGAKICADTVIGANCEIHPGAVIGGDGFGFAPQADGTYKTIPQIGNVIIEDQVSIGTNTTIDCATMGSTIIKKGAKIDNLVQIAHNVSIGENTVIASQTGISGSTEIGKNCIIAGQVGIAGHLKIADNTTIGAKSGIIKSVKEKGSTLFGYIAMDMKNFLKSYSIFKNLSSVENRIKELEKKK